MRAERVHHVVAVALRRRHERLDPRRASGAARRRARRRTSRRPRRRSAPAGRTPGPRGRSSPAAPGSGPTSIVIVERKSSTSPANRGRAHARANSKRWVDLVQRDVGPELGRVERPVALERGEVRHDEEQRAPSSSRGTATSYCPSTRWARNPRTCPTCVPWSSGPSCVTRPPIGPISARHPFGHRAAERLAHPSRRGLEQAAEPVDVREHPSRAADRTDLDDVGRRREASESGDLQLGDPDGLRQRLAILVGGIGIGAGLDGGGDRHLPRQLPVHRSRTRTPSRAGARWNSGASRSASGSMPNGKPGSLIRPAYDVLALRWPPCRPTARSSA